MQGSGFRVWGVGFGFQGIGFRVQGWGFYKGGSIVLSGQPQAYLAVDQRQLCWAEGVVGGARLLLDAGGNRERKLHAQSIYKVW